MTKQKQIIFNPNTGSFETMTVGGRDYVHTGVVRCPCCETAVSRYTPKVLGLEISVGGCDHFRGIVSAGGFDAAAHFEYA